MAVDREKAEDLIEALEDFKNAWFLLSEAWDDFDSGVEVESYPFTESFNEIRVAQWVQDFKEVVKDIRDYEEES